MNEDVDDGGPAFPCMPPMYLGGVPADGYPHPGSGMSLRAYAAIKFAAAMLSNSDLMISHADLSNVALKAAEAMILALKND